MVYRHDDHQILLHEKSREAIALAMACRWQEAAAVNRELLDLSPDDLDASNRLAKALLELGDTQGALDVFGKSLQICPTSAIARRNVDRLTALRSHDGPPARQEALAQDSRLASLLFVGDSSKSAQVTLLACAGESDLPFVSPGALVRLERQGNTVAVCTQQGLCLGLVPPTLGRRLASLMQGGNEYQGIVSSAGTQSIKVVLRESYRHPSQRARASFPASAASEEPAPARSANERGLTMAYAADAPGRAQSWLDEDADERASTAVRAVVGAVLDGGIIDDLMVPDLPEFE